MGRSGREVSSSFCFHAAVVEESLEPLGEGLDVFPVCTAPGKRFRDTRVGFVAPFHRMLARFLGEFLSRFVRRLECLRMKKPPMQGAVSRSQRWIRSPSPRPQW